MILGLEEELNLAVLRPDEQHRKGELVTALVDGVTEVVAAVRNPPSPASPTGYMTALGSKIYVDAGDYVEIATAETRTPLEALVSQRVNERILLDTLTRLIEQRGFKAGDLKLIRACTDYAGQYRGFHQNFLTRHFEADALVEHLVPFLVTRFASCAGGFGPSGFVMTHKNESVKAVASQDTRENRGILNLKQEPLGKPPYKRVHITHGDATMSEFSTYLSIGSTALVIKMLDDGASIGPAYKLLDPIRALRILDTDLNWSKPLPLASGSAASALEIQEHFLKAAESYVPRQPYPWMREVTERWRTAIDALRGGGPDALSRLLDPFIKRRLYQTKLRLRGLTLEVFSKWCAASCAARTYLSGGMNRDVRGQLREEMPAIRFHLLADRLERAGLSWGDLPRATTIYNEMLAFDLQYHDVAPDGVYFELCNRGLIDSALVEPTEIARAMEQPPSGTRARARGMAILEAWTNPQATADWHLVSTGDRRVLLSDPFSTRRRWLSGTRKKQP